MADKPKNALDRARQDLAAGRPDRARDRITGFLYGLHREGQYSEDAYRLLAQVYFEMHDLPQAGAAWLLTEEHGAQVEQAVAAFHERYGQDPVNILKALKPHALSESYPPAVQERLSKWGYRYRQYRSRTHPFAPTPEEIRDRESGGLRPIELGCAAAALILGVLVFYWVYMSFFRH